MKIRVAIHGFKRIKKELEGGVIFFRASKAEKSMRILQRRLLKGKAGQALCGFMCEKKQ